MLIEIIFFLWSNHLYYLWCMAPVYYYAVNKLDIALYYAVIYLKLLELESKETD